MSTDRLGVKNLTNPSVQIIAEGCDDTVMGENRQRIPFV